MLLSRLVSLQDWQEHAFTGLMIDMKVNAQNLPVRERNHPNTDVNVSDHPVLSSLEQCESKASTAVQPVLYFSKTYLGGLEVLAQHGIKELFLRLIETRLIYALSIYVFQCTWYE